MSRASFGRNYPEGNQGAPDLDGKLSCHRIDSLRDCSVVHSSALRKPIVSSEKNEGQRTSPPSSFDACHDRLPAELTASTDV